jgi:hypothetical protein
MPVTSFESREASRMRFSFSQALSLLNTGNGAKRRYTLDEYLRLLPRFVDADSHVVEAPNLQVLPEGVCNIVAVAASSFRRANQFLLVDIGASTVEFVSFSIDSQDLTIFHSKTLPIGVRSLKSQGLLREHHPEACMEIDLSAKKQYINESIKALVAPVRQDRFSSKSINSIDLSLCGGGSLIPEFSNIFNEIPESRLQQNRIPRPRILKRLDGLVGYEQIPADLLPRYLVACGLTVPKDSFPNYKLPKDLATAFRNIEAVVWTKPFSHLDDNWDYNAIK